jgi:DNA N-6-adenine-methyltransferase (Dam)
MSNEWYTPLRYIAAAREVMGDIDLDPASCEAANQTVKANRYYTIEDDGLSKPWSKRVWLNPPYGRRYKAPNEHRSIIALWVEKLLQDYQSGAIDQAILLCIAHVQTKWFQLLWDYPICFVDHYVRFYLPEGSTRPSRLGWKTEGHTYGTIFVYLGHNERKFAEVFSQFGTVIPSGVTVRRQKLVNLELWSA